MNNNIIPACIIGAGLFAVALKPAPQPAPIPQAEPVAITKLIDTDPVIVWHGTNDLGRDEPGGSGTTALFRAWSDGKIEMKIIHHNDPNCAMSHIFRASDWVVVSSPEATWRSWVQPMG